jgi:hypothetical protein
LSPKTNSHRISSSIAVIERKEVTERRTRRIQGFNEIIEKTD